MPRLASLEALEALYAERGGLNYGEGVSQMEHAVQCAALAEAAGAEASLVIAALLHDVGHLFEGGESVVGASDDARHEISGAQALKGLFNEAVRAPIALHVSAKRYLCFTDPNYYEALSPASKASLALQGGPFEAAGAATFERRPYWREAVALRRFDDTGKADQASGLTFADFLPLMRRLQIAAG